MLPSPPHPFPDCSGERKPCTRLGLTTHHPPEAVLQTQPQAPPLWQPPLIKRCLRQTTSALLEGDTNSQHNTRTLSLHRGWFGIWVCVHTCVCKRATEIVISPILPLPGILPFKEKQSRLEMVGQGAKSYNDTASISACYPCLPPCSWLQEVCGRKFKASLVTLHMDRNNITTSNSDHRVSTYTMVHVWGHLEMPLFNENIHGKEFEWV